MFRIRNYNDKHAIRDKRKNISLLDGFGKLSVSIPPVLTYGSNTWSFIIKLKLNTNYS